MNNGNDESDGKIFPFSSIPMDLQTLAMSLNMINMKLLTIRAGRTRYTVDTVQAIMDGDTENIDKRYEKMFAKKTLDEEWKKLEETKTEIDAAMAEGMSLFEAANTALLQADKPGVDFSLLRLPDTELADLKNNTSADNIYERMSEYNDILNNFLYTMVEYCGKLGMSLLRIQK